MNPGVSVCYSASSGGNRVTMETSIRESLRRAEACLRAGEHASAIRICRSILYQRPDDPEAHGLLGVLEGITGRPEAALQHLLRASELRPGNPGLINNLALAYMNTGDLPAAEQHLKACLRRNPGYAPGWYTLAIVKRRQGDIDAAVSAYERVLSLNPRHAEAWANLAQLRERLNQLELASEAVESSLAINPGNAMARLTASQVDGRLGRHESAINRLEDLLSERGLSATNEIVARGRLGDALDALGRTSAAFQQYREANRLQAELLPADGETTASPYSLESVNRMTRFLGEMQHGSDPGESSGPSGPFFLMGFPRSGTTLLDRMLSAHPDVVSVEEQETLVDAQRYFLLPPDGIERLRSISDDVRGKYQEAYRRRLADAALQAAPVLLDKLPLHTIFLPLISRLFPDSRVIFVVRDPRDVCLSCFMQRFELNTAMSHFLDLGTTASYYRAVMQLGLASLDRLPIRARLVRYESLITEPEPLLRELISFLGLDWDPAVLRYREKLAGSRITTPSYRQVSQPLYRSSIGRWRRYAAELESVLPELQPLVSQLGYD